MKERPILFSTGMVQGILGGRKTVTRRVVKPQPPFDAAEIGDNFGAEYDGCMGYPAVVASFEGDKSIHNVKFPYGVIGDLLWVRETFYAYGHWTTITENGKSKKVFQDLTRDKNYLYQYHADWQPKKQAKIGELGWHKRPSLFMPRIAARLFLKITDIRVERLQDIINEAAIAEGVRRYSKSPIYGFKNYLDDDGYVLTAKESFETLWVSINGRESWDGNPWVWVVGFERVENVNN